jgi:DHA2 family multidrug resistance protein
VTNRAQVRHACLVGELSPFFQPCNDTVQRVGEALVAHGAAPSAVPQTATGWIYQSLLQQAGILAYIDLFAFTAIMCALIFLFAPVKAGGAVSTGA